MGDYIYLSFVIKVTTNKTLGSSSPSTFIIIKMVCLDKKTPHEVQIPHPALFPRVISFLKQASWAKHLTICFGAYDYGSPQPRLAKQSLPPQPLTEQRHAVEMALRAFDRETGESTESV